MNHAGAFAIGTFRATGSAFPGLVLQTKVLDLGSECRALGLGADVTVRDILESWDRLFPILSSLAATAAGVKPTASGPMWLLDELTTLAPVEPRQVLQSGANYHQHVIDLAAAHTDIAKGRTPDEVRSDTKALMELRAIDGMPYVFIGLPSAVAGVDETLMLPSYSEQHDWELELAAVIGRRAFRVTRDEALDFVAGYTIVNDVSTRDMVFRKDMKEIGTDWFRSKNAPGFLPTGPYIVPTAFVGDVAQLTVTLELNGRVMQNESTADMIFPVEAIISAASQITPLLPGDLILTGSPSGNGLHWGRLLRDGDVMDGQITGLGTQHTVCAAEATR